MFSFPVGFYSGADAPLWWVNDAFAYNGIYPKAALCFKKNRYMLNSADLGLTGIGSYSRSQSNPLTSSATVINDQGYIERVAADVIRVMHKPLTGEREGVIIERTINNTIRRSEDFGASDWANHTNTSWIFDAAKINPAGTLGAYKLAATAVSGVHYVYASSGNAGDAGCAHSVFLGGAGLTQARLEIWNSTNGVYGTCLVDFTSGTIVSSTGNFARIRQFKNGWWRVEMSATATTVKAEQFRISLYNSGSPTFTGDGVSGVYVWGAMTEPARLKSSSYIWNNSPSGSATRSTDNFSIADISSWFTTSGTLLARFKADRLDLPRTRSVVSLSDGTTTNSIGLSLNDSASDTNGADIVAASASIFSNTIGTYAEGEDSIIALAFANNSMFAAANSIDGSLDTSGTIPTLNQLNIGNSLTASTELDGIIEDIIFYQTRAVNIDVSAFSSAPTFADMDAA